MFIWISKESGLPFWTILQFLLLWELLQVSEMHFALRDSHKPLRRSGELWRNSDVLRCQTNKGWQLIFTWLHWESPMSLRAFPRKSVWKVGDTILWNVVLDWKEDTRWAKTFISLLPGCRQCGSYLLLLFKRLPYYDELYRLTLWAKLKGEERKRKRRKRWWKAKEKEKLQTPKGKLQIKLY